MRLLIGNYRHSIDSKGRVAIPQRFRQIFTDSGNGDSQVAIFGFDGCLFCYPATHVESILTRLSRREFDSRKVRELMRLISECGAVVDIDAQGRVQLSEAQRASVGLDREALLIGAGARVEIWSPERFENRAHLGDASELAEGILRELDSAMGQGGPTTPPAE